jgi:hypothetical protein
MIIIIIIIIITIIIIIITTTTIIIAFFFFTITTTIIIIIIIITHCERRLLQHGAVEVAGGEIAGAAQLDMKRPLAPHRLEGLKAGRTGERGAVILVIMIISISIIIIISSSSSIITVPLTPCMPCRCSSFISTSPANAVTSSRPEDDQHYYHHQDGDVDSDDIDDHEGQHHQDEDNVHQHLRCSAYLHALPLFLVHERVTGRCNDVIASRGQLDEATQAALQ